MAKRRMFSLDVVDTDKFLNMPPSTQALYYNLGVRADDDGFVSSPRKIASMSNCGTDDLNILVSKGYLIPFDSGVVVITDWNVNNYIQKDRYTPTRYQEEKAQLIKKDSMYTKCVQDVCVLDTQDSIDKSSIDKGNDSIQKLQNEAIEKLQNEDFRPFNFRALENDTTINNNTNNNNIYIIVEYLNEKAGTHYKASTAKTKSLINARLKEGFTIDDFKTVIDKKVKEWLKDVKMAKYIRPETLFGTKFEGYLNEKGSSCTGATNNRFNNFHQRENNLTDKELEMMLVDNNKKAPQ